MDDSPTVRAMAEHLVVDAMRKAPSLAHNHFLEAAFVLNCAKAAWLAMRRRGGAAASGSSQGASLSAGCDLPRSLQRQLAGASPEAQARRFVIYKVCRRPWASRAAALRHTCRTYKVHNPSLARSQSPVHTTAVPTSWFSGALVPMSRLTSQ